jgi:GAF domain-containing protein
MNQPKKRITEKTSTNSLDYQLKQRNAELAIISTVQKGLAAKIGLQDIYDLVGDQIRNLFDAQVVAIAVFNFENNTEAFRYIFEDGKRFNLEPRPIDKVRQRLIDTQDLLCINENADEIWSEITGEAPTVVPGTKLTKSALYVPMKIGNDVPGYISLQNLDREHAFSESDIRLLTTLTNSMSVALENARLFNETEQRNAELAVINSVQEGLAAEMDMQGIYDLVGDQIRKLFDAQVTVIRTFNHKDKLENYEYAFEKGIRLTVAPRPIIWANKLLIDKKEPLLFTKNYLETAKKYGDKGVTKGLPPKSAVFVPMFVSDQIIGSVSLQNVDKENAYNESDVRLLTTLTNSMSVALENARLFNETEQRNAELAVINSVQQGLVAEMDMQGIYDLVGDKTRTLFDSQVTVIGTFDHENHNELFNYAFEDGKRFHLKPRPFDKIRQRLIKTRKLIDIRENASEAYTTITGKKPKSAPGTTFPKSMVFVPLLVGDTVRGYVSLQNLDKENAFSDSDIRLLSTLANSMSVALENARLFNEAEQRNAELAVINSVQQGLVAEMDMQGIYDLVGDRIRDLFDAQVAGIVIFNHDDKTEDFRYLFEDGDRFFPNARPYDKVRRKIIDDKKTLLINEKASYVLSEILGQVHKPVPGTRAAKSAVYVPMVVGETVLGYVTLQNLDKENAYSDSDVSILETLVNSMTVALENARLFNETTRLLEETKQRASELQTVNKISHALVSQLDLKSLIKLIGDQMLQTFNADIVYLALHDKKANMLYFPYMYGEDDAKPREFGNGITEKIIINKEPLLINKNMEKVYEEIEADKKGRWVQSYLGVPIVVGDVATGVISVQSTEKENRFNEYDLRLLKTIAANVGVAMQNAEDYEKLQIALNDLESAQEQLIQQEKLASLGQLSAGIAHEIKNPLNFVNNFSELNLELIDEIMIELEKLSDSPEKEDIKIILKDVVENQKKIHQHGTRADSIVKSMLLHSRGGNSTKETTDINDLLKEYVNLAFHGMRAGKKPINVSLDFQLDVSNQKVAVIMEDLSRVILNLCNNAFDAMHERIQKKKASEKYQPKLIIKTFEKSKQVIIEVQDNGLGIPLNLQDKILMPFFTTKRGTEGTGLGLSITNDIIKAHGGRLKIDSQQGDGSYTKFIINLPI